MHSVSSSREPDSEPRLVQCLGEEAGDWLPIVLGVRQPSSMSVLPSLLCTSTGVSISFALCPAFASADTASLGTIVVCLRRRRFALQSSSTSLGLKPLGTELHRRCAPAVHSLHRSAASSIEMNVFFTVRTASSLRRESLQAEGASKQGTAIARVAGQ